jgi:hypothetical protein
VGEPALADLDLVGVTEPGIDLAPVDRVRVRARRGAPRRTGQDRGDDGRDHRVEVVLTECRTCAPEPPEVVLVRLTDVVAVDHVAAVADARSAQQHVIRSVPRDLLVQSRHARAGVRPQHVGVVDVPGVAAVARDIVRAVAEPVVVVGDRDDAGPGVAADGHLPRSGERSLESRRHELDRVVTLRRIGQVAQRESALERVGASRDGSGGDGGHGGASQTGDDGLTGRATPPAEGAGGVATSARHAAAQVSLALRSTGGGEIAGSSAACREG